MPAQRAQSRRTRAQPLRRIQGRRALALQADQVDVLVNALAQRRARKLLRLLFQVLNRLRAFAARRQHLSVNLDRGALRRGQPRIVVELLAHQEARSHLARLAGEGVGAVELFGRQRRARQPGIRRGELRLRPGLGLMSAGQRFGAGQVVLRDPCPHRVHDGPLRDCGDSHQKQYRNALHDNRFSATNTASAALSTRKLTRPSVAFATS